MLLPEQVQRLVELALAEFAPEWQVTGLCSELSLHNPEHWVSGLGTFGLILRNRQNRSAKVLGWRSGDFRSATYHRGISYRVLEAYADRITADRAQGQREDLGRGFSNSHFVGKRRLLEIAEEPKPAEQLAERRARSSHDVRHQRELVA